MSVSPLDGAALNPQAALIHVMVITAAADTDMSDAELRAIGNAVQTLPVFAGFDPARLSEVAADSAALLDDDEGLDRVLDLVTASLKGRQRETAYALACEIVAVDGEAHQEELRLLEMLRHRLDIDRLIAAGIERGIAARYRPL